METVKTSNVRVVVFHSDQSGGQLILQQVRIRPRARIAIDIDIGTSRDALRAPLVDA